MNEEIKLILKTLSAQIKYARDGELQDLWNQKIEIEEMLNPEIEPELAEKTHDALNVVSDGGQNGV